MFALRDGIDALKDRSNQRRLGELSDKQMQEVAARVQKFMPHIAPAWKPADVQALTLPLEQAAMMTQKQVEDFIEAVKNGRFSGDARASLPGIGEDSDVVLLDPRDPMAIAHALVTARFTNGCRLLHHHRGTFWLWQSNHYALAADETIRTAAWIFMEGARRIVDKESVPFKPSSTIVSGVAGRPGCGLPSRRRDRAAGLAGRRRRPSCRRRNVSGRQRAAASAERRALSVVGKLFRPHRVGRDVRSRRRRACALADISRPAVRRRPRGSRHLAGLVRLRAGARHLAAEDLHDRGAAPGRQGHHRAHPHRAARARQRDRADAVRAAIELRAGAADREVAGDHFRRPRRRQVGPGGDCRAAAVDLRRGQPSPSTASISRPGPGACRCDSWC